MRAAARIPVGVSCLPCLGLVLALVACKAEAPVAPAAVPAPPPWVGADRDAHGCIGSAGYLWCAKEGACARPWELAKEKGFDLGPQGFERYCAGAAR